MSSEGSSLFSSRAARSRAFVRGEIESLLGEVREGRASAEREDRLQLERLAALLPAARAVGLSFEAVSEISGVSRPTLTKLRAPNRVRWSDAELAVLLSLAMNGPQTKEQVTRHASTLDLGKGRTLGAAVDVLQTRGLVATVQGGYGEDLTTYFRLTEAGTEAMRSRLSHAGIGEEFRWSIYFAVPESRGRALQSAGEAKLGAGEVALLYPGQGPNEYWEVGFMVRAANREEALALGHRRFEDLCRSAGIEDPSAITYGSVLIAPHP